MPFRRGQLRYFVTVAEEGQMTRAARMLYVAQPTLSHAIAQLESELGVQLLARHPRGVTLTPAGEVFFAKARAALTATAEAAATGQSLARAARGAIAVGFIGAPPELRAPELFEAFADAEPDAELSFRELSFPRGATASWLEEVDVALCHAPSAEAGVCVQALRAEPRGVVAPKGHPLARRRKQTVAEVLDETFLAYDSSVQPAWAAFHTLDDHRGSTPRSVTVAGALTSRELLAMIASRQGIAAVPVSECAFICQVLPGVVAVPLCDAHPAVLSLIWREDNHNPLVERLAAIAEPLAASSDDSPLAHSV